MNDNINIPYHMGIILDGNGRWATMRNKSRNEGHIAGYENLKKIASYILKKGVKILSVYAFSTENFKRSTEEVSFLMAFFIKLFKTEKKHFLKENIKVVFSGKKEGLSNNLWNAMKQLEEDTKNNTKGVLNICLNYGGKDEIINATKNIVNDVINNIINIKDINEETYNNYLYNNLPPIDFLIRTSGEKRTSNFMIWQSSYAELYFPTVLFPDFDEKEVDKALIEYAKRDRRFGGIKHENKIN